MSEDDILIGMLLDDTGLTVAELADACSVSVEWVVEHVADGALSAAGSEAAAWNFSSRDLSRARRIRALERDFDAVPELAALVADLLEEVHVLRGRLRSAGLE